MSQTPPDYPCPRNPRIHRQSGIPSISRPRVGTPSPNTDTEHQKPYSNSPGLIDDAATPKISSSNHTNPGKTNAAGKMSKLVGFQFLSKTRGGGGGHTGHHNSLSEKKSVPEDPISKSSSPPPSSSETTSRGRRVASMPPFPSTTPHPQSHAHIQAQIDIDNDRLARRGIGLASPPIVDFTRFEDMYRSPRNGTFEGLLSHRTPKPKPATGLGVEGGGGGGGSANNRGVKNRSSTTGSGVKPALKTQTPVMLSGRSTTAHLSVPGGGGGMAPPHPASERKPDPRLVVCTIVDILGSKRMVEEYLNSHELLAAHQLDQLDFEERDAVHAGFIESGKLKVKGRRGALVVLGEPIRRATLYSSTTMVLGGRDHVLPILVVNCVEELYRTGIYQPQLFRALPNRTRLLELIAIFDSEHAVPGSIIRSRQAQSAYAHTILIPNAGFGTNTSLHLESTPDICALLTTYLSSLGEPILPPFLFRAVWDWCALDDADEDEDVDGDQLPDGDNNHDQDHQNLKMPSLRPSTSSFSRRPGLPSTIPLSRTYTSPSESTHILLAQLLLHLMPSPNFSLLIYLLAFFSQVALVREENGVGVEDLSRMFGGRIFGGGSIPSSTSASASAAAAAAATPSVSTSNSKPSLSGIPESCSANSDIFNTTQTRREGETMMSWFLRRWGPISEGLFDVVDDAKMGLFRRTLARKDSFGKDVLSGWVSGATNESRVRYDEDDKEEEQEEKKKKKRDVHEEEGKNVGGGGFDGAIEEEISAAPVAPRTPMAIPTIRLDMAPQGHSTPRSKTTDSWMRAVRSQSRYEEDEEGGEKDYGIRPGEETEEEEVDIVDDYVVIGSNTSTTPTPTPTTVMRSNPLEVDDTLDIGRIPSTSSLSRGNTVSVDVSPGDERLMDISLPTFLNQTLPGFSQHTAPDLRKPRPTSPRTTSRTRNFRSFGVQTKNCHTPSVGDQQSQEQQQLSQALQDVAHFERRLRSCTDLVSDTLKDLEVSRRESFARGRRIVELERVLAGSGGGLVNARGGGDGGGGGGGGGDHVDDGAVGSLKGKGKETEGQADCVHDDDVFSPRN